MISGLVIGLVVGFVLAMPPGPVGVTLLRYGLRGELRGGTLLVLGTSVLDMLFSIMVMSAASMLSTWLSNGLHQDSSAMLIFQVVCVVAIIGAGILQLRPRVSDGQKEMRPKSGFSAAISRLSKNGPFLIGVAIGLTNIANPFFFPSLLTVAMTIQHLGVFEPNATNNSAYALGFATGNFLWGYLLVSVIAYYRHRFSAALVDRLHQFAGITMIGVGSVLGFRVLFAKWPELLLFPKWIEMIRLIFAL